MQDRTAPSIILQTDSYKLTHWKMYKPNTAYVGSYFESRGGEFKASVFFGLQYILLKHLTGVRVTKEDVHEAKQFCDEHFGQDVFNFDGWMRIVDVFGGKLPISIKAVPEGTIIPTGNVLFTIENTDPESYWLTNHLETLLVQCWYPTTVATQSKYLKNILATGLSRSGSIEKLPFMLHDFGYRGSTSDESAGIGGAAHLVNFVGTDTLAAIRTLKQYYGATEMTGFSVPAAEHSTIVSWGRDNEVEAYNHILDSYKSGLVSVVSDTYDIFRACSDLWGTRLRNKIIGNNDRTLVIRPDSGDPTATILKCLNILASKFGYTTNDKGFKTLRNNVRLIQGDGITKDSLPEICNAIMDSSWSLDNIIFGSGGGLLQKVNRDTLNIAIKMNWSEDTDGTINDVYKNPMTDPSKRSKAGKLKLVMEHGYTEDLTAPNQLHTYSYLKTVPASDPRQDKLEEVFRNGELLIHQNIEDIRSRANAVTI